MNKILGLFIICLLFLGFCSQSEDEQQLASKELDKQIESIIPIGSQGLSLSGKPLIPPLPSSKVIEQYNKAKIDYEKDLTDPETLIWYGRRTAYMGKYLDGIKLFSKGINLFPQDPRFWRHLCSAFTFLVECRFENVDYFRHGETDGRYIVLRKVQ